jgi:hypothetical protein
VTKKNNLPVENYKRKSYRWEQKLNSFIDSVGDLVGDISALEINTIVVENISADKFIPWQAYVDIYPVCKEYLEELNISPSLRDRYLSLRRTLEIEYALLLSDPQSEFYQSNVTENLSANLPILTDPHFDLNRLSTKLPSPLEADWQTTVNIHCLLDNHRFLRSLRKVTELKSILDNRDRALAKNEAPSNLFTDLIYGQTIIQLDGNIINRYPQEIFDNPYKQLILQIHKANVEVGEKQWRGLFSFILNVVKSVTSIQKNFRS